MSAPALLVVDGNSYMSTKAAAQLWNLQTKTVSNYCKDGKIKHCFKNGRLGWYIRTDEIKPLSQEDIRRILVLTLQLKNNPAYEIDWTLLDCDRSVLESTYNHLQAQGYICDFSVDDEKRLPYEVVLTQKGMELVTTFKKTKIASFPEALVQWMPIMINVAQLYFQMNQTAG